MHRVVGCCAVARGNAAEQACPLARGGLSGLSARRGVVEWKEWRSGVRAARRARRGRAAAREIEILERLIRAYEDGAVLEQPR
ncbi:hypothetical protein [Sorangium sp. So ce1389]|uniref:hypothetical protein n=1 Tax=Sorangium sp. So ce1389 TaxID=3133336 RepID=UPI003F619F1E